MNNKANYETVNCCLCGKAPESWVRDWHGQCLSVCPSCGLRFVSPRLKQDVLKEAIYTDAYHHNERAGQEEGTNSGKSAAYFLSRIGKYKSSGGLFDVSAGNGAFLLAAKKRGWAVSGSEINQKQSSHLADMLGCRIYTGYMESIELKESYDVVTFIHVLEHTANPVLFLKKCATALARDGILYGVFPNTKSLSDRFKTFRVFRVCCA